MAGLSGKFGTWAAYGFAAVLQWALLAGAGQAHEVVPAVGDMTRVGDRLEFVIELNVEGVLAGVDMTATADTNLSPAAADYDALRALPPDRIKAQFAAFWPDMAGRIRIAADGVALVPEAMVLAVPDVGSVEVTRLSQLSFRVPLPEGARTVTFGWDAAYGAILLRQQGVELPADLYLEAGAVSEPVALAGGGQASGWQTFLDYIPVGFDHIVPKGLDHILFVLGLFFLSARLRPLLWQVSAFTLAHTITLGLAAAGYVSVPAGIVEPLIAASIVFVAVENLFTDGLSRWRPFVVFGFGLLHGLGFAAVLGQFGLPEGSFLPALIGFNIGVELGQLAVILAAFLTVTLWFGRKPWYKARVANPASVAIALAGAVWVVQRTWL